jgi:hypothetical protein
MSRGGEDLVKRLPKAERAVTDGDFRGDLQPTAFRLNTRLLTYPIAAVSDPLREGLCRCGTSDPLRWKA